MILLFFSLPGYILHLGQCSGLTHGWWPLCLPSQQEGRARVTVSLVKCSEGIRSPLKGRRLRQSLFTYHSPASQGELGLCLLPRPACGVEHLRISEPQGPARPGSCGLNVSVAGALGSGPILGVYRYWPSVQGDAASCAAPWRAPAAAAMAWEPTTLLSTEAASGHPAHEAVLRHLQGGHGSTSAPAGQTTGLGGGGEGPGGKGR